MTIPALFVMPTLMLFLYLIFETAKFSREKIRHQFAVDSAAFIEMTNYTDLLNRSAYVNGSFPMRVFRESYPPDIKIDSSGSSEPERLLKMMWDNAVFPDINVTDPAMPNLDQQMGWPIKYADDELGVGAVLNANNPGPTPTQHVFRQRQAERYWIWYDIQSTQLWQFFVSVYQLLGSVEDAQIQVYKRLSGNRSFYVKSWMLNTGLPRHTAKGGAFSGKELDVRCIYSPKSGVYGRFRKETWWDPLGTKGFGDDPQTIEGGGAPFPHPGTGTCPGLFRVAVVSESSLGGVYLKGPSSGVEIDQEWTAPSNYFGLAVNRPRPRVHARVGVVGCCVWAESTSGANQGGPKPTPKFQTRLLP